MTKTKAYKAQLVPMEENSRISIRNNEVMFTDDTRGFYKDSYWSPQRLIITDETGYNTAAYPTLGGIPKISLADVRKWIDNGCSDSVELEVELSDTHTRDGLQPRLNLTNNTVKMVFEFPKEFTIEEQSKWVKGVELGKAQPIAGDVDKVKSIDWEQAKLDFGFFAKVKRNNAVNASDVIGWIKQYYQFPFKTEINGK